MSSRVAVVTGASRGIGREIALELARQGHKIACVATRKDNAEPTAEAIRSDSSLEGAVAEAWGCDVSDALQVGTVFAEIASKLGPPEILINNAGIARDSLLMRMKDEDWNRVLQVNLTGAYLCVQACVKGMMKARWGRIVNVTSVIGLHGAAGQANYAASKAGLVGLTLSIAKELGSRGITCNAVAPGFVETDMTVGLSDEFRAHAIQSAPLGRLGTPKDVAAPVAFLCSEAAGFITGQVLSVDGGLFL